MTLKFLKHFFVLTLNLPLKKSQLPINKWAITGIKQILLSKIYSRIKMNTLGA